MKAFTIRGVEPEVAEKLKMTAQEQGKSVNQIVLDFIKKNLGFEKGKKHSQEYTDLDDLFGRGTEDEFKMIHDRINQSRQIDQELWK